jgi:hypothetical protein
MAELVLAASSADIATGAVVGASLEDPLADSGDVCGEEGGGVDTSVDL